VNITGRVTKNTVALTVGLLTGSAYAYSAYQLKANFESQDAGLAGLVAVAMSGAIICLCLSFQVSVAADLGKLQEERQSLSMGLVFTFFLGVGNVLVLFLALPSAPGHAAPDWIIHTWGGTGCSAPIAIRRGLNEGELVFEIAGEFHPHRIVGRPTQNSVETDQGIYTLGLDGSMTTTEQGMENDRLTRCDR
jgi:hypothetical protein